MRAADADLAAEVAARVAEAAAQGNALRLVAGDTKAALGRAVQGAPLSLAAHRGIVDYEPTELTVTARSGTPLAELETALADEGQMLAFEPPHFGAGATLGGTVACGLSGPRRPYAGALRDHVLGAVIVNGRGEVLRFGGRVMKNVAGYDLARLMCGAHGTLGVLLELSLKVLPRPAEERTLRRPAGAEEALELMNQWAGRPLPLSATCYDGEALSFRLSGAPSAVQAAARRLGGEPVPDAEAYWRGLREQTHGYFRGGTPLWRLSVPPATPVLPLEGRWLYEWGGAQRWYRGSASAEQVRAAALRAGGHATRWRGAEPFQPLPTALAALHRRVKAALDPAEILNPGRLYPDL
ncbi:glycolate oxidase subunit GlcE [Ectothiorhodospiraceae bacterium 2226]|nr:glycolate oxidase subunit GlcE [Ectothiorhodospiraceae bacterium 2226]